MVNHSSCDHHALFFNPADAEPGLFSHTFHPFDFRKVSFWWTTNTLLISGCVMKPTSEMVRVIPNHSQIRKRQGTELKGAGWSGLEAVSQLRSPQQQTLYPPESLPWRTLRTKQQAHWACGRRRTTWLESQNPSIKGWGFGQLFGVETEKLWHKTQTGLWFSLSKPFSREPGIVTSSELENGFHFTKQKKLSVPTAKCENNLQESDVQGQAHRQAIKSWCRPHYSVVLGDSQISSRTCDRFSGALPRSRNSHQYKQPSVKMQILSLLQCFLQQFVMFISLINTSKS